MRKPIRSKPFLGPSAADAPLCIRYPLKPPSCSHLSTMPLLPHCVGACFPGFIQAAKVPVVGLRLSLSWISTKLSLPLNSNAFPDFPSTQFALRTTPLFPFPDLSLTRLPWPSSKGKCNTRLSSIAVSPMVKNNKDKHATTNPITTNLLIFFLPQAM